MAAKFKLTAKQLEANEVLASPATHVMLAGGSRSGKTLLLIRAIVIRALKAPGSRHAVLRFRFGHAKQSIAFETLPFVMNTCFPDVAWELNRSDWFAQLPGRSEIWIGGLDDKERTEKILGREFATIFLNECSQIPWYSRNMAVTRLAQKVEDTVTKRDLQPKMYYDENPPDKGHWTYKLFKSHQDPDTKGNLQNPDDYAFFQINPGDNRENLPEAYFKTLEALPVRLRKRFLEGEFRDMAPNALFNDETLERWRVIDDSLPDMVRVVVAVDPSGAEDEADQDADEIGIVVCGLGTDGNGYVLEDLTCRAAPEVWGRLAVQAFERHAADRIVAELNFGGAMVAAVIRAAGPRVPFRGVRASRGKAVRAEPIATLFEQGRARMGGYFRDLEDELTGFTTHGFMGDRSPNRADAMVWALTDLFGEITQPKDEVKQVVQPAFLHRTSPNAWMRR